MKKGVVALGNQIQEEFIKAQGFVAELDLSDHPLSATIATLSEKTNQLMAMLKTDSKNSNLPPSQDPHRSKEPKAKGKRKPGAQTGHKGARLVPFENPDEIIPLEITPDRLPEGAIAVGYTRRQVVQYKSRRHIVEYQAQTYRLLDGTEITAPFPEGITSDIQYGQSVKAFVAYTLAYQLMPYRRIADMLADQIHIPASEGSIYNFLKEAYERLEHFDYWLKRKLINSHLVHVDETGINVNGKTNWIHTIATENYTLLVPHVKRGREAIDDIGILPAFTGFVCHDCWSSYFAYDDATHVLCNAHIMRELKGDEEKYSCRWARLMHAHLREHTA